MENNFQRFTSQRTQGLFLNKITLDINSLFMFNNIMSLLHKPNMYAYRVAQNKTGIKIFQSF